MLKNCLKAFSPVGSDSNASTSCLSLFAVRRTKDGSSLSIVRRSCCIALVGLNFVGAVGAGKETQIVRSKSRITKFFVIGRSEVLGGALLGVCWMLVGGAPAVGGAMVERGGSVIDPRSLHVEKPTKLEMTF